MPSLTPSPRFQAILSALMARAAAALSLASGIAVFGAALISLLLLVSISCVSLMTSALALSGANMSAFKDSWLTARPALAMAILLFFSGLSLGLGYLRYRRGQLTAIPGQSCSFVFLMRLWGAPFSCLIAPRNLRINARFWTRGSWAYFQMALSALASFPLTFFAFLPALALIDLPVLLFNAARLALSSTSPGGVAAALRARVDSLANEGAERLASAERKALDAAAAPAQSTASTPRSL